MASETVKQACLQEGAQEFKYLIECIAKIRCTDPDTDTAITDLVADSFAESYTSAETPDHAEGYMRALARFLCAPAEKKATNLDADHTLHKAECLLDLSCWIEQARQLIEEVGLACELDPQLKEGMRMRDVAINDPCWQSKQSQGLGYLKHELWECLQGAKEHLARTCIAHD